MSRRLSILLVGILPPSSCFSAATTVQVAATLAKRCNVTIVIDNIAPPPTVFTEHNDIHTIRLRELQANTGEFQNHLRLYIMGDTSESLFTLDLYQQAPGVIIPASGNLNHLFQHHLRSAPQWPQNYTCWLQQVLGHEGKTIAEGVLHHRRVSHKIIEELPAPWAKATEIRSDSANEQSFVNEADICLLSVPLTLHTDFQNQEAKTEKGLDDPTPEHPQLLYTANGVAAEALKTLENLHPQNAAGLHAKLISGAEENLAELVANADIILITDETPVFPPLMALGIQQGKAIITCGQRWARSLPSSIALQIDHAGALHQMVAAIGALYHQPDLRAWYGGNARKALSWFDPSKNYDKLLARLTNGSQSPLDLPGPPTITGYGSRDANNNASVQLREGAPRSIALVGAVPPRTLVEKLFPQVDWDISPRFATLSLAETLCADAPEYSANKLALLGYETSLISNTQTNSGLPVTSWEEVKKELRATDEALTFGCYITGAANASQQIALQSTTKYKLALQFRASEATALTPHYDEHCGLFWRLDAVRHQIDCLLIAGIPGCYKLTLDTQGFSFMVADAASSSLLEFEHAVTLTSDFQGVLSFSVKALDLVRKSPLDSEVLIKMLAECSLNLEWLNHD